MLGVIIWGLFAWAGARAERITWKPFAAMLALITIGGAIQIPMRILERQQQGRPSDDLTDPAVLAFVAIVNFVLYCLFYFGGYTYGRWRRRRNRKAAQN